MGMHDYAKYLAEKVFHRASTPNCLIICICTKNVFFIDIFCHLTI